MPIWCEHLIRTIPFQFQNNSSYDFSGWNDGFEIFYLHLSSWKIHSDSFQPVTPLLNIHTIRYHFYKQFWFFERSETVPSRVGNTLHHTRSGILNRNIHFHGHSDDCFQAMMVNCITVYFPKLVFWSNFANLCQRKYVLPAKYSVLLFFRHAS